MQGIFFVLNYVSCIYPTFNKKCLLTVNIHAVVKSSHQGPHSPQTTTVPGSAESSLCVPQSSQQVADVSSDVGQIQGQLQQLHGLLLAFSIIIPLGVGISIRPCKKNYLFIIRKKIFNGEGGLFLFLFFIFNKSWFFQFLLGYGCQVFIRDRIPTIQNPGVEVP